jgi:hypothetical protein
VIAEVEPAGAVEERLNIVHWGELARADQIRRIGDAEKRAVRHGLLPPATGRRNVRAISSL